MGEIAELKIGDQILELPIVTGSEGERAIDIGKLRAKTGLITLDPAYINSGSCTSEITFIDGEKGILRYRGIAIEELAGKSSFLETAYLLIHGELPPKQELDPFVDEIKDNMMLQEDVKRFYEGFPRDAHPMAILASVVCSLSTFYQGVDGSRDEISRSNRIRILAKLPTVAAFSYKKSIGQPFVYPSKKLGYAENFLHMMFATPTEDYQVDPDLAKTLDLLWILHADHEQNCSTSTVRLVRSSMPNLFACITSGICALWGSRHGGANQRVIEMFEKIIEEGADVRKYIDLVKDKKMRLMGFGHRVYKTMDPRAEIIKKECARWLARQNKSDPLLDVAKEMEEVASSDPYFIERNLYPNVDFYSGILFREMGIPVPAFPVMFALGRLPGWIAQATEFTMDTKNRIGRPRQIYTGPAERHYVPVEER